MKKGKSIKDVCKKKTLMTFGKQHVNGFYYKAFWNKKIRLQEKALFNDIL